MRYAILIAAIVILAGCTETRTETQGSTSKHDTLTIHGTASVPIPGAGIVAVPVEFHVERNGSEESTEQSKSTTKLDTAAIAQQVSALVSQSLAATVKAVTGASIGAPSGGGWDAKDTGIAGAAATAAAWALREMLNARAHKQDSDKGWDEALKLAKKIRPEDAPA